MTFEEMLKEKLINKKCSDEAHPYSKHWYETMGVESDLEELAQKLVDEFCDEETE